MRREKKNLKRGRTQGYEREWGRGGEGDGGEKIGTV